LIRRFLTIQHRLNPLHVYCRLLDRGLSKHFSAYLCRYYETLVFIWLSFALKTLIHVYCAINKSSVVQDELKNHR